MALCLLGFRGSGYSPSFVDALQALQDELRADPTRPVRLVTEPDAICAACPNLATDGCRLGGPGHEAHVSAQDGEVLARLGLGPGAVLAWAEVLARVAERVRGGDLPGLCTTCPWLPLGVCRASVDALAAARGARS
jgi:hypothetical protein